MDLLAGLQPACREEVVWPGGQHLEVTTFLVDRLDGEANLSSVRAVVLSGDREVLVVSDPTSTHILPGGRIQPGESLDLALKREIGEESGWTVLEPRLIGVLHFHHLKPRADGVPATDFLQAVFAVERDAYHLELREQDGHETGSEFVSIEDARSLDLTQRERMLLKAALLH